jgi:hypothetical protein
MRLDIRNALGELIIGALDSPAAVVAMDLLSAYCQQAKQGSLRVLIRDLRVQIAGHLTLEAEEMAFKLLLDSGLFCYDPVDPSTCTDPNQKWIEIQEEFSADLPQIHHRANRYRKAAQKFYEGSVPTADDLAGTLLKGAVLFNQGLFFEVHEVLEAQWKQEAGDLKVFLQGLIQVAVAFYHLENQNYRGALILLKEGQEKLLPYRPRFLGIELEALTAKLEGCHQELRRLGPKCVKDFVWQHVPKIHWEEVR